MVKDTGCFTIERSLLKRFKSYMDERKELISDKKSKSSIVEEALAWYLVRLEKELAPLKRKDIAVVR